MSARQPKLTRVRRTFREGVRTPLQFWLLTRMLIWSVSLRILRLFLPLRRLLWLSVPTRRSLNLLPEDILRYLGWLDLFGLLGRSGYCLVRALVCHRFLTLAGQQPTLLIGFNGNEGHAWVDLEGEAVLESDPTALGYRPLLIVPPFSRQLLKAAPLSSVSADLDDLDGE